MLSFGRSKRHPSGARVPFGHRVYAVGDIHGRIDLLDTIRQRIVEDAERAGEGVHSVIYLGDYVDRGPGSPDVLTLLVNEPLPGFSSVFLKGNHEDMMLRFLEGSADETWLYNGGEATLASYGIAEIPAILDVRQLDRLRGALQQAVPEQHLTFLESLAHQHTVGSYMFVHAGVRPGVPLDQQRPSDLMWIRDRFLRFDGALGKCIVHGHSITRRPDVRSNRIGIDTGAYHSGRLTCVVLEDDTYRFLHT